VPAQTAMQIMADGLTRPMALILSPRSFVVQFMPGARGESVHIAVFRPPQIWKHSAIRSSPINGRC
jgi:hypothetical protein